MSSIGKKIGDIIDNIFFKWVLNIVTFCLVVVTLTPLREMLKNILPVNLNQEQLSYISIFLIVFYGSQVFQGKSAKNRGVFTLIDQQDALSGALSKISGKNHTVDILIYTSYSLFNSFEARIKQFPSLKDAQVRILVRDPDIPSHLPRGILSRTRIDQVNIAIDAISKYMKEKDNIQIKFYRNEPWVRGIKVGNKMLYYSTYADKRTVSTGTNEPEYSGSETPWVFINADSRYLNYGEHETLLRFIDGFNSLYDMIWHECTKYKTVIFDLDGTLFRDEKLSKYLRDELPNDYFREQIAKNNFNNQCLNEMNNEYSKILKTGISSTESIIKTISNKIDTEIDINDYLDWKDSNLPNYPINIEENKELAISLESLSSTCNVYILTNHTKKFSIEAIKRLGLEKIINNEKIISINDIKIPKPNPEILSILEGKYKINIDTSIFIGDREKVDLSYAKHRCLATILMKKIDTLPEIIRDLRFPVEWIKKREGLYDGIEISIRQNR